MFRILSHFVLLFTIAFSTPSWALFGNTNNAPAFTPSASNTFVPVDEAFPMNFYQQGNKIFIDWQVKDDYYLYQDRISISGENVLVGHINMRDGQPYHDEFFGDVNIYTEPLLIDIPLSQYQANAKLIVQYQGCAKAGFCYPPETRIIDIKPFSFDDASLDKTNAVNTNTEKTAPPAATQTRDNELTDQLGKNWWTPALFYFWA